MANNHTQFEQLQINQTAGRHDELGQDVRQQMSALRGEIETTLAGASSDMTRALHDVYNQWSDNVQSTVLTDLGVMAQSMRDEAGKQETGDQDNSRVVRNSPVSSYIGR